MLSDRSSLTANTNRRETASDRTVKLANELQPTMWADASTDNSATLIACAEYPASVKIEMFFVVDQGRKRNEEISNKMHSTSAKGRQLETSCVTHGAHSTRNHCIRQAEQLYRQLLVRWKGRRTSDRRSSVHGMSSVGPFHHCRGLRVHTATRSMYVHNNYIVSLA